MPVKMRSNRKGHHWKNGELQRSPKDKTLL